MKTHAFPIQFAKEAILQEQYTTALEILKPLSQKELNIEAQFLHAYLHFWDDKLTRLQAIQQLERIAEQGHSEANYILAVCPNLEAGYQFSLPTNAKQLNYLQRAVDAGSIYALTDLAECHLTGIIVNGDLQDLRTRLLEAFEMMPRRKKYPKLCFYLGKMLLQGIGGNIDIEEGLRILSSCILHNEQPFANEALELGIQTIADIEYAITNFEEILSRFTQYFNPSRPTYNPLWHGYLQSYCQRTLIYDLHDIGFDAYCDFVFDHLLINPKDYGAKNWNDYADVIFDPTQLLRFYTELFQNSSSLLERYSPKLLDQGLGLYGICGRLDWSLGCVLEHPKTSVTDVIACERSMVHLFDKLFQHNVLSRTGFMWWDIDGYGMCRNCTEQNGEAKYSKISQQIIRVARFKTQVEVLNMNSLHCQKAAIHGLGHSKHHEKELVLLEYLENNPDLPASLREYALDAIKGRI